MRLKTNWCHAESNSDPTSWSNFGSLTPFSSDLNSLAIFLLFYLNSIAISLFFLLILDPHEYRISPFESYVEYDLSYIEYDLNSIYNIIAFYPSYVDPREYRISPLSVNI